MQTDWTPGQRTGDDATGERDDDATGEEEAHRSAVDAVDGLLDEVELALARLDDGTYGRCESCGTPIDDTELQAQPLARQCRSCTTTGADPESEDPTATGARLSGPERAPLWMAADQST